MCYHLKDLKSKKKRWFLAWDEQSGIPKFHFFFRILAHFVRIYHFYQICFEMCFSFRRYGNNKNRVLLLNIMLSLELISIVNAFIIFNLKMHLWCNFAFFYIAQLWTKSVQKTAKFYVFRRSPIIYFFDSRSPSRHKQNFFI